MMEVLSQDELTRMTITLWPVWTARRKLIHEGVNQSPLSTHLFVTRFIAELDQIRDPRSSHAISAVPRTVLQEKWIPPPEGCIKLNVDAGFSTEHNVGAGAVICRDRDGAYLGSTTLVIQGLVDPASLEAIACREALSLVEDMGVQHLFVASDCKAAVNHILEGVGGNYGGVIKEIKEWMKSFTSCVFVHEHRSSNFEAHKLARHGVSLDQGRHVWLGYPHDPIVIPVNIPIEE